MRFSCMITSRRVAVGSLHGTKSWTVTPAHMKLADWKHFAFSGVSIVKYGGGEGQGQGQSGQAIKLFQAPRKISFTFHF